MFPNAPDLRGIDPHRPHDEIEDGSLHSTGRRSPARFSSRRVHPGPLWDSGASAGPVQHQQTDPTSLHENVRMANESVHRRWAVLPEAASALSGQYVFVGVEAGAEHVALILRMSEAVDAGDGATLRELHADNAEYTLVSQGTYRGRDDVVAAILAEADRFKMTRDLFTADGSGRVWWRFAGAWTDLQTGRARHTTGASVAQIDGGKIQSVMSWVDVIAATQDVPTADT